LFCPESRFEGLNRSNKRFSELFVLFDILRAEKSLHFLPLRHFHDNILLSGFCNHVVIPSTSSLGAIDQYPAYLLVSLAGRDATINQRS
jgi:hypothetical protein